MTTAARRDGITLLEVVVALAIFLMSLVAISQLLTFGSERSTDVKLHARASLLCQRELNKRIAGVEPLGGNSTTLPDDKSAWQCDVEVADADITGLKRIKVTVRRELDGGRIAEATLTQLVLDPTLRGSTHDVPSGALTTPSTEEGADTAADAGGQNNNAGGGNAGGGNAGGGGGNAKGGNTKGGGGNAKGGGNTGKGGAGPRGGGNTGGGFGPGGGAGPGAGPGRTGGGFGPGGFGAGGGGKGGGKGP
jgi:hypothetical protein